MRTMHHDTTPIRLAPVLNTCLAVTNLVLVAVLIIQTVRPLITL